MNKTLILIGIIAILCMVSVIQDMDSDIQVKYFSASSSDGMKPLTVVDCTPDTGYTYCDAEREIFAYAEIQHTYYKGDVGYGYVDGLNRRFYLKEVYIDVKFEGDYLYASNSPSWPTCNDGGCPWPKISPGKYVVVTAPSKIIPEISFIAFDKDYSSTGNMYWAWVGSGFYPSDTYVINCYDNGDCDSGTYCDKSGAWDTWSCEIDPCNTMPAPTNVCDGFELWSQKCLYGEYVKDQLLESESIECGCVIQDTPNACVGFDLWSQKQSTPCVEGLGLDNFIESNSIDCGCLVQDTPDICAGFDLWSQKQVTPCVEGLVQDELIEAMSIGCGYLCSDGETKSFICTDNTIVITQHCSNNEWIDTELEACPFNWINLKSILEGYIDDIKEWMDELL